MKRITLITILLLPFIFCKGQFPPIKTVGDTIGPWTVISFEEPSPDISILPIPHNIWQIGPPQKSFFSNSFTLPNAIVTDTINFYPVSNISSFELMVGDFNMGGGWWRYNLFIDFRHKFDTDTLRDGGFISVSWDNKATWLNIRYDTVAIPLVTPGRNYGWQYYGNTNLYDTSATLFNGTPGFSGNSGSWIHSCMAWYDIPVKNTVTLPGDTMYLRFNFISDDIPQDHEGWMIDQIRLFNIDLGSGIEDYMKGESHSYFYPNPVSDLSTFIMKKSYHNVYYELRDSKGLLLSKKDLGSCDEFIFNRDGLGSGVYFLRLVMDNRYADIHKIIITP